MFAQLLPLYNFFLKKLKKKTLRAAKPQDPPAKQEPQTAEPEEDLVNIYKDKTDPVKKINNNKAESINF